MWAGTWAQALLSWPAALLIFLLLAWCQLEVTPILLPSPSRALPVGSGGTTPEPFFSGGPLWSTGLWGLQEVGDRAPCGLPPESEGRSLRLALQGQALETFPRGQKGP